MARSDDEDMMDEVEEALAEVVQDSVREQKREKGPNDSPKEVFIIPLNRRPFFPGMAAPIVIEPGPYYEVLKIVAKTEHKCMGLFLTKKEDATFTKSTFKISILWELSLVFCGLSRWNRGSSSCSEHGKDGFRFAKPVKIEQVS